MKILTLFLIVFFIGCGTDTASGPGVDSDTQYPTTPPVDDIVNRVDIIDSNPVVDDPGTNPGDNNNTDPGDGTGGGSVVTDSIFDVVGAELDPYACMIGDPNEGYTDKLLSDRSADDRPSEDVEYGVLVSSWYPFNAEDPRETEVTLYYTSLKPELRQEVMTNIVEENYLLSFNKAWADNDRTTVYVMTPKNSNGFYGCYRYELSSLDQNIAIKTKVYRNN